MIYKKEKAQFTFEVKRNLIAHSVLTFLCELCLFYLLVLHGMRNVFAFLVLMILHILEVLGDKLISLLYTVYGAEWVGRGIECIVHELFNCC